MPTQQPQPQQADIGSFVAERLAKLLLGQEFVLMPVAAQEEFVESVRRKRYKPVRPVRLKVEKVAKGRLPKAPKALKPPKEPKPRKPRVKKTNHSAVETKQETES